MRICALISAYAAGSSPVAELDPAPEPGRWLEGHEVEVVAVSKADVAAQVEALAKRGFDVFLNLCDGVWFEEVAGIEVVEALERLEVPFTGPTSRLYALTKEAMKAAAGRLGVPTPAFAFVRSTAEIEAAAGRLRFPLIVKHFDGFGSVGMSRASRVTDAAGLHEQAQAMIALAGAALVEEYVAGEEYAVLVAEEPGAPGQARALAPVRCAFPPGESFRHFDLKWSGFEALGWLPCADAGLAGRLEELSRRIFVGIEGVSYARCDFRVDERGEPWFLEINTTCGIFYPPSAEGSADMILRHDPIGHRGFLEHVLRCALARRPQRRAPPRAP